MAAEDGQTGNHVVSSLPVAHFGPYGFDNASGLVPKNGGGRTGVETLLEVHVAMTDACRDGPY
jgi:hypothetical protein